MNSTKFFEAISKEPPEYQAQKLRQINDRIKQAILPRNDILEMTRNQTVANSLRSRERTRDSAI